MLVDNLQDLRQIITLTVTMVIDALACTGTEYNFDNCRAVKGIYNYHLVMLPF
jgi:hypothetical protein